MDEGDIIRHKIMDGIRGLEVRQIDFEHGNGVSFHYNGYRVTLEIKIKPEKTQPTKYRF